VILIAEIVGLTLRFDTGTLKNEAEPWSQFLGWTPQLLRLAIAILAATLLVGGSRLWQKVRGHLSEACRQFSWGLWLLVHLLGFAAFICATAFVLEGHLDSFASPEIWVVFWFTLGLITISCWCFAVLPARIWGELIKQERATLVTGTCVGLGAWAVATQMDQFWHPFGLATLGTAHNLLELMYADAFVDPDGFVVGTSSFSVAIGAPCSGYEGVGLIVVFLVVYLSFFRSQFSFPRAFLLLPLGAAIIWFCNALRITLLIVIGSSGWPALAMGGFHSQTGWLAFNAVALGLVGWAGRARFFIRYNPRVEEANQSNHTAAYLVPFLSLVATAMITRACCDEWEWASLLRVVLAGGCLWLYRGYYAGLGWSLPASWLAIVVGLAVSFLWITLAQLTAPESSSIMPFVASSDWVFATWLAIRLAGYIVIVPAAEELVFRGYLTRRLIAADFRTVPLGQFSFFSFLASSILFGALHGAFWLPGTLAGALFALVLYRRRRIIDAVLAHAITNSSIAVYVLATGDWSLWA
jgi:exosortase E/protease (VPEID-CTERM system)